MKKFVSFIIGIAIVGALIFGIYKFFFDCERKTADFGKYFVLGEMDYAKISNKVTLKLIKIEDNRCLGEECKGDGQYVVKFFIKDDRHIAYESLGSVSESSKDMTEHKLKYSVELIDTDGKTATFNVTDLEEKER